MSRSLVRLVLIATTLHGALVGCSHQPPVEVTQKPRPEIISQSPVQAWLRLQQELAGITAEQARANLAGMAQPETTEQLFHHALLNQNAGTYQGWIIARDAFRRLRQDDALTEAQQQLAGLLEQYNQNRINWHQRYGQLQQQYDEQQLQLDNSQQQQLLLEQKIQAITELEATISNRKEEEKQE